MVSARLRRLAGPAIIVLALTQTFASIDWIMSLTPHWYSTIFGVYFFAGSFVGFIALLSVVAVAMRRAGLLDTVISAEHLHDIGKFLFAFTAFWAYIAFSQFFLMWYANLPEETIFYKARMEGSWLTVSLFLMAGHFGAPFFYLMGRDVKRRGSTLAIGGAWLLAMHFVDLVLASHADAPSRGVPSVGSGRRRFRCHRRVLRGGGELAHATAGARSTARPEACRIAGLRERLRAAQRPDSRPTGTNRRFRHVVDDPIEEFCRRLEKRMHRRDSGVVDQNVKPPEVLERGSDSSCDVVGRCDVAGEIDGAVPADRGAWLA